MNRAKRFCTKLSEIVGTHSDKHLTKIVEEEILSARKTITETNQVNGSRCNEEGVSCSIKRNTQEQVVEINMCEYLTALNRYSNELLPGSYDFSKSNTK